MQDKGSNGAHILVLSISLVIFLFVYMVTTCAPVQAQTEEPAYSSAVVEE